MTHARCCAALATAEDISEPVCRRIFNFMALNHHEFGKEIRYVKNEGLSFKLRR